MLERIKTKKKLERVLKKQKNQSTIKIPDTQEPRVYRAPVTLYN